MKYAFLNFIIFSSLAYAKDPIILKVINSGGSFVEKSAPTSLRGQAIFQNKLIEISASTIPEPGGETATTTIIDLATNRKIDGTVFLLKNIKSGVFKSAQYTAQPNDKKVNIELNGAKYVYKENLSKDKLKISVSLTMLGEKPITHEFYQCVTGGKKYPICGDDGRQEFHWAGDIDGDNKLDLIVMFTKKYSSLMYHLYLSSQAEKGKLLKKVSESYGGGC